MHQQWMGCSASRSHWICCRRVTSASTRLHSCWRQTLLSCIELCIFLCCLVLFVSILAKWLAGRLYSRDIFRFERFSYKDCRFVELFIVMVYWMYSQNVTLLTFSLISLFLTVAYFSKAQYGLFVLTVPLNPDPSISLHSYVWLGWCDVCIRAWDIFTQRASFTRTSRARTCFLRVEIRRPKSSSQTSVFSTSPNSVRVAGQLTALSYEGENGHLQLHTNK